MIQRSRKSDFFFNSSVLSIFFVLLVSECVWGLPAGDNEASGVYLSEARKYASLPDLNELTHLHAQRDVNIWASKLRAARRSGGEDRTRPRQFRNRKFDSYIDHQSPRLSATPPRESPSPFRPGASSVSAPPANDKDETRPSPSSAGPFKRLIELPLWQTSLLSAKYVLHHESDVVTYRERTFPTAR